MLLGEYEHTIDAKGRLAMPAKLRESLGGKFIITKGLDGCLFVYDMEQWQKLEQKLSALLAKLPDNTAALHTDVPCGCGKKADVPSADAVPSAMDAPVESAENEPENGGEQ